MNKEMQPPKRKGGLIVDVILWAGIGAGILLGFIALVTHLILFYGLAMAVLIASGILGAATNRLFKTQSKQLLQHVDASFQKGRSLIGIGMLTILLSGALMYLNTIYHNDALLYLTGIVFLGSLAAHLTGCVLLLKRGRQIEEERKIQ